MYDLPVLALILFSIGAVLLTLEVFLPTHGVLGAGGLLALFATIVVSALLSPWLAVGVVVAMLGLGAYAWEHGINLWQKTPIGRRMVLPPVKNPQPVANVSIGQTGRSISALRPTGECEIAGRRIEAQSEIGMIEANTPVSVVAIESSKVIVRTM